MDVIAKKHYWLPKVLLERTFQKIGILIKELCCNKKKFEKEFKTFFDTTNEWLLWKTS